MSGIMPDVLVLSIGAEILAALKDLHQNNMVHRDIKPANILLGTDLEDERAYLIDFGLIESIGS
jgi:serine/threonine protein kinase